MNKDRSEPAKAAVAGQVDRMVRQHEQGRFGALMDVMRAESAGKDLQDGPLRLHVCAMRRDGTLYELGSVSTEAAAQDPQGAIAEIARIKFARRRAVFGAA